MRLRPRRHHGPDRGTSSALYGDDPANRSDATGARPSRRFDIVYAGPLRPALGGAQIHGTALLNRLAERGHRVRSISPLRPELREKPIKHCLHPNIEHAWYEMAHVDVHLGYRSEVNPPGLDRKAYFQTQCKHLQTLLEQTISYRRPDVVLIGRESFIYGIPEFVHAHDIPCVLLAHGAAGAVVHDRFLADLARPLLRAMAKVDAVIAVAKHMGDGLRMLGLPAVATVSNPVDITLFAPRRKDSALQKKLGIAADDFVVYHASNLKAVKRPLDLIAVAGASIRRRTNLRFLICGEGPFGRQMKAYSQREGIASRVHFTGWVENERLPAYLSLAHVAIMCSETEGQPLAALEAMACARPVVGTAIPAFQELVAASGAGLLAPVGDTVSLTRSLLRLVDDRDLRRDLGAAGRATVVNDHNSLRTIAEYESAIAAVVGRTDVVLRQTDQSAR